MTPSNSYDIVNVMHEQAEEDRKLAAVREKEIAINALLSTELLELFHELLAMSEKQLIQWHRDALARRKGE
jgi:hypothetical protein